MPLSKPWGASFVPVVLLKKYGVTTAQISLAIQDLDYRIIQRSLNEKYVEWHCQPLVKWHFQFPTASQMSGVWERLIRDVQWSLAILTHLRPGRSSEPCLLRQWEYSTAGPYAQVVMTQVTGNLLLLVTSFSSIKGCPCHGEPFKMRTYTPTSSGEGANFSQITCAPDSIASICPCCRK